MDWPYHIDHIWSYCGGNKNGRFLPWIFWSSATPGVPGAVFSQMNFPSEAPNWGFPSRVWWQLRWSSSGGSKSYHSAMIPTSPPPELVGFLPTKFDTSRVCRGKPMENTSPLTPLLQDRGQNHRIWATLRWRRRAARTFFGDLRMRLWKHGDSDQLNQTRWLVYFWFVLVFFFLRPAACHGILAKIGTIFPSDSYTLGMGWNPVAKAVSTTEQRLWCCYDAYIEVF